MNTIERKIRHLSLNQLRALALLCESKTGLVSSTPTGQKMEVTGRALGGVFSSLSRQKIGKDMLLFPVGRGGVGRGLRWKLNEKVISLKNLKKIVNEILSYWEVE